MGMRPNRAAWFALGWYALDVSDGLDIDPKHYRTRQCKLAPLIPKSGIAKVRIPAQPRTFSVELEDYETTFDVPGSDRIRVEHCSQASSAEAVAGMDRSGEYIEMPLYVRGAGRYVAYVAYAAEPGTMRWLTVEVKGCGSAANTVGFTLDEGTGTT